MTDEATWSESQSSGGMILDDVKDEGPYTSDGYADLMTGHPCQPDEHENGSKEGPCSPHDVEELDGASIGRRLKDLTAKALHRRREEMVAQVTEDPNSTSCPDGDCDGVEISFLGLSLENGDGRHRSSCPS